MDGPLLLDFTFSAEWNATHGDYAGIAVYNDISDEFVKPYLLAIKDGHQPDETNDNQFWAMIYYDYAIQAFKRLQLHDAPTNNQSYTLSVSIIDGISFNISWNNKLVLSWTDWNNNNTLRNGYSGYIGIESKGVNTKAK